MLIFWLPLAFFWSAIAMAADPCATELSRYCPDQKSELEKINCLATHRHQLSPECQKELVRLNQLVKDTGVRGAGLSSFAGIMSGLGFVSPQKTVITADGNYAFEGNPTVINEARIGLSSPLWKKDGEVFTSSLNAGTIQFNEAVPVPKGRGISELHRVEAGIRYSKTTPEKKTLGVRGSFGSAADRPFASEREFIFTVNAFYVPPPKTNDSLWIWTVFLSNNSPIGNYVPIPGFIYLMKKQEFTGMFGLPFMSVQWTPAQKWLFSASIFLTNIKTSAIYLLSERSQLSLNFANIQQTFLRVDRTELRDRLFFNERKVFTGYRQILSTDFIAELQGGLSFDRNLQEGLRFNDTNWRTDLGRSWFIGTSLVVTFN